MIPNDILLIRIDQILYQSLSERLHPETYGTKCRITQQSSGNPVEDGKKGCRSIGVKDTRKPPTESTKQGSKWLTECELIIEVSI